MLVQILHLLCPCQRKQNTKYQINFAPSVGILCFSGLKMCYITIVLMNYFMYIIKRIDLIFFQENTLLLFQLAFGLTWLLAGYKLKIVRIL